ncbi:glycoprotein antigen BM86-like isoform X1 [Haemaphysalis longicornis]
MRICVGFLAGVLLISGTVADGDVGVPEEAVSQGVACQSFGNRFCNGPCKQTPGSNDTFSCACPSDEFYFDAVQRICLYKTSCVTQKCSIGFCKDGRNKVFCHCEGIPYMTLNCKVQKFYQDECEERGGQALMPTRPAEGPRCACGEWTKADIENKKCVPSTCLRPTVTCKELCEKGLLGKDPRCCQGWNETDCTREPENGTYCSPGSLINKQGRCQDACSARQTKLICPYGCRPTPGGKTAYQCWCPLGKEVAEDGISCKVVPKVRLCREDEQKACRPGQSCEVRDEKIICRCRLHEHFVDGVCTEKCRPNDCHEHFLKCVISNGKEECRCPWKDWRKVFINDECTLKRYYYTVSFKPNISLEHDDCDFYGQRVFQAMRTALGSRVHMVQILNCTKKIKVRLIFNEPLPELLRKKLQMCEYQEGEYCMLYPSLPIEKGSATEIEEENLCESVLKEQEVAYNGTNKCVKDGNIFWFKCAPGFKEVNQQSVGRLRRSICEPDTDDPNVEPADTDDPNVEPAGADDPAVEPATQESKGDPATKGTTEPASKETNAEPASKGTTAEPEKSAGSSPFKPHFLELLLLYGGVVTLLQILH